MDLSRPAFDLFGSNEGRLLHRLAVLTEGTSGRRIHELSGVKSLRTTQQILERLVIIGLVDVRGTGAVNLYSLNRHHILWEPVNQVLEAPAALERKIGEILSATVGPRMVGAALYGSFARGEGGRDSDIDIFVLWADEPVADERIELLDAVSERIRRLSGNSAQMLPMTSDELESLVEAGDPLIASLRADARALTTGFDITEILGRGGRS